MRAQTLPAAAGWQWLVGGFAIYRRNPVMLTLMVFAYWIALLLLNVVPGLGMLLAAMAMPGLTVGLMQAVRDAERGQPLNVEVLIGGLRANPRTLLALGAVYLCCWLGILGVSALADDGELLRFMLSAKPGEAPPDGVDASGPLLVMLLLMTPLQMAYWFAPVLAAWHRLGLGKAMFFSFVACWLNWRAFLAYGGGLLLALGVVPAVVLMLLVLVSPGLAGVLNAFLLPLMLAAMPVIFASFYVSYRDIFGISEIV